MKLEKSFDLSRDPSEYRKADHLHRRMSEVDRKVIDNDMMAEAIEEGEVVDVNDNDGGRTNAVIRHQWLMTTFEVVVGVEDPVIQTAYEGTS